MTVNISIQTIWWFAFIGIALLLIYSVVFYYHNKRRAASMAHVRQEPTITSEAPFGPNILNDSDGQMPPINEISANLHEPGQIESSEETCIRRRSLYDPNFIVLQIKACNGKPYMGYELHQALLAVGLRFGRRNIFHHYAHDTAGKILFSLAAATSDGEFAIEDMGSFKCDGLVLFMPLDAKKKLMANFDLMLDTARQLVEELGGELCDDMLQPLNVELIRRLREKICNVATNNLYVADLLDSLSNV